MAEHEILDFVDQLAAALKTALPAFGVGASLMPEIQIEKLPNHPQIFVYPYGESSDEGSRSDDELALSVMVAYVCRKPSGDANANDAWLRGRFADLRTVRRAVRRTDIEGGRIGETSSSPIYDLERLRQGCFFSGMRVEIEYDDAFDSE